MARCQPGCVCMRVGACQRCGGCGGCGRQESSRCCHLLAGQRLHGKRPELLHCTACSALHHPLCLGKMVQCMHSCMQPTALVQSQLRLQGGRVTADLCRSERMQRVLGLFQRSRLHVLRTRHPFLLSICSPGPYVVDAGISLSEGMLPTMATQAACRADPYLGTAVRAHKGESARLRARR